ncbi:hypothetical protein HDU98_012360 [Podochytrium sp. JEL0797]|nr:hypothetical protein HDU98_012360 [Podochytrium sp. JEL0797]
MSNQSQRSTGGVQLGRSSSVSKLSRLMHSISAELEIQHDPFAPGSVELDTPPQSRFRTSLLETNLGALQYQHEISGFLYKLCIQPTSRQSNISNLNFPSSGTSPPSFITPSPLLSASRSPSINDSSTSTLRSILSKRSNSIASSIPDEPTPAAATPPTSPLQHTWKKQFLLLDTSANLFCFRTNTVTCSSNTPITYLCVDRCKGYHHASYGWVLEVMGEGVSAEGTVETVTWILRCSNEMVARHWVYIVKLVLLKNGFGGMGAQQKVEMMDHGVDRERGGSVNARADTGHELKRSTSSPGLMFSRSVESPLQVRKRKEEVEWEIWLENLGDASQSDAEAAVRRARSAPNPVQMTRSASQAPSKARIWFDLGSWLGKAK